MPRTSIRLPKDLEAAARAKCQELDLNLSQVIRSLLRMWIEAQDETPSQAVADESQATRR